MEIAFGPEAPGFGSWEWVGQDLAQELGPERACTFRDVVPECEVVVFVKFKPSPDQLLSLRERCQLVYFPVDIYGSAAEIDGDSESLQQFDCVVSHSPSLLKYFSAYSRVEYLDHHVKYVASLPRERKSFGPILWTGNAANLPPLIEWGNRHPLPEDLWVLTNLEQDQDSVSPTSLGFNSRNRVRIENWSPQQHRDWATIARAAIDIKGNDFRSRHKPPTKAFDFIASGLPLAMNLESRPVVEVAERGLQLVEPTDIGRWFSEEYWLLTQRLGGQLNFDLTRSKIAQRFLEMIS